MEKSHHTFLIAEIIFSPSHALPKGSSPWNIGLASGVLNKFFRLRLLVQMFSLREDVFHKGIKDRTQETKKKDK